MLEIRFSRDLNSLLKTALKEVPRKVTNALEVAMRTIAMEMRNQAGSLAPFKTGTLRRSITTFSNAEEAVVGTNLVYARIHDLGGMAGRGKSVRIPKFKGRGYLTPAFQEQVNTKAKATITKNMERILDL